MHISEKKLKDILLASGVVDENSFESARQEAARMDQDIADILIGCKAISEDYLLELLASVFNIPVVDLRKVIINEATRELLDESFAKTRGAIVFKYDAALKIIHLAMRDPLNFDTISHVHAQLKATVLPYFTNSASLHYGLKQYKKQAVSGFTRVIEENVKKFFSEGGEADIAKLAEAVPIVTILDSLFEQALAMNASDIHFEPFANALMVRYRIDGILQEAVYLPELRGIIKVRFDLFGRFLRLFPLFHRGGHLFFFRGTFLRQLVEPHHGHARQEQKNDSRRIFQNFFHNRNPRFL